MVILGTCVLSIVFPPVNRVFRTRVRVVEGLPFGLILGTAFMRQYQGSLIFEGPGSGSFKPTPGSDRVPLLSWLEQPRGKSKALNACEDEPEEGEVTSRRFCAMDREQSPESTQDSQPSEILAMEAPGLGATAWEDEGTLQWPIYVDKEITIPGSVSVEIGARVTGPVPYAKTLVLVFPVSPFDLRVKPSSA